MVGAVNLFWKEIDRERAWRGHPKAGCCDHFVDSGCDVRRYGNPVVKRLVSRWVEFGGGYRDLLAPDARVRKKLPGGFLEFTSPNSYFSGLSCLGALGEDRLQVGMWQLGGR